MSSRRKFFLAFFFMILDMFLLIGFLVIRDAVLLNDLKREVNTLAKLDITKDRFNRPIRSRGSYAIVEEAIKEYLDDYALTLQEVLQVIQDSKLTTILSYDNYHADGPDFLDSLEYLDATKKDFNSKIDILLANLEEEKIRTYINDKINDPYYRNLYVELMMSEERTNEFQETRDFLSSTKIKVNHIIDVSEEVLNFLVLNQDSWELEEGEIKFLTQDLYEQYMTFISSLNANR